MDWDLKAMHDGAVRGHDRMVSFMAGLEPAERSLLEVQEGRGSHFSRHFWAALVSADGDNLARFELGFPEAVRALREWRSGTGWKARYDAAVGER